MCPLPRLLVRPVTPRATRDVTSQTTLKSRTLWHLSVSTIFFAPLCRPLPKNLELKQWRTWSNSLWIWIRIQYFKWIRIRIQGFDDQIKNLLNTFMIKNWNLLIPSLYKGRPNYKRSFQPSKKNIQNFKKKKFLNFLAFLGVIFAFLDPDPGPGTPLNPDPIRIRIDNTVSRRNGYVFFQNQNKSQTWEDWGDVL